MATIPIPPAPAKREIAVEVRLTIIVDRDGYEREYGQPFTANEIRRDIKDVVPQHVAYALRYLPVRVVGVQEL